MPLPPIKESMQKAINDPDPNLFDWPDCTVRAAFRLALQEIERLELSLDAANTRIAQLERDWPTQPGDPGHGGFA